MKRLQRVLLCLAVMAAAIPPAAVMAEGVGIYITPKVMYAYEMLDADSATIYSSGWMRKALGGEDNYSAFGIGGAAGLDFHTNSQVPARLEVEYMFRGNDNVTNRAYDLGIPMGQELKVNVHSIFANGYLDLHNFTNFTPYVGAGLGLAYLDTDYKTSFGDVGSAGKTSDWNFAWNVGAGVAWSITDFIALDLGYRYADFGKTNGGSINYVSNGVSASTGNGASISAHEFMLGLRLGTF